MRTVLIVIWTLGARFSSVAGECKSNLFWFWHPHYQCKEQSRLNSVKLNPWKYQIISVRSLYKVRDYISHNDLCSESNTLYLSEFLQKGIQSSSHVSKMDTHLPILTVLFSIATSHHYWNISHTSHLNAFNFDFQRYCLFPLPSEQEVEWWLIVLNNFSLWRYLVPLIKSQVPCC